MTDLIVRLADSKNHNNTFDLEYSFLENAFVDLWIERLKYSQSRGDDISTRDQFYGLNSEWSAEKTIALINERVEQINALVPNLIDRKIQSTTDQDTLNYLHAFFERYHGKIDSWLTDPWWQDKPKELRSLWSDLNNYIHRLEGYRSGSPHPRIKIAWYDTPKTKTFAVEDYKHFVVGHRFGYMYSLYSDVGKDLRSLACDEDDHHLDFVPPTYYSADVHLRFHTESKDTVADIKHRCWSFYDRNEKYFLTKGYDRTDPKLVMGSIPIAKLSKEVNEQEILTRLSQFNRVQSVNLL